LQDDVDIATGIGLGDGKCGLRRIGILNFAGGQRGWLRIDPSPIAHDIFIRIRGACRIQIHDITWPRIQAERFRVSIAINGHFGCVVNLSKIYGPSGNGVGSSGRLRGPLGE